MPPPTLNYEEPLYPHVWARVLMNLLALGAF